MAKEKLSLSAEIPATPKTIYQDWLSSKGHTDFTGGAATIKDEIGSSFTAWDGYISGKITALEPNKRIIQSWRTSEFREETSDSTLEIIIIASGDDKSILTINHSNIPEGDGAKYDDGWKNHYIEPMIAHYTI
jgi:activator of HSP90 ATPase